MSRSLFERREMLALGGSALLVGCTGEPPKPDPFAYTGPMANQIVVNKANRDMWLLSNDDLLRHYKVDLGFQPRGHKEREGDGRTPEGLYHIDRRNPASAYYLSLGISYPNAADIARARALGVDPGGDIFIHGGPRSRRERGKPDWTAGCIAVSNREMAEIYVMTLDGAKVWIKP